MIYASTSCLKNPSDVLKVLEEYDNAEIENVELGSVHKYFKCSELKKFNFNFLVHNYFPPPKIPFNFNLASKNSRIRKKSVVMAKNAIKLCSKIDSPLYTFHAGFTVDPPKLGKPFPKGEKVNRDNSISTFYDSVGELIEFAKKENVELAMEPNVVQKFNLINNNNELLLFADIIETKQFCKKFSRKDIGILLDLGHTLVTSHWLNFDKNIFVGQLKSRVKAVHISNNNGLKDQHKKLVDGCWPLKQLKYFKNKPIILETMNLTSLQIKSNISLVEKYLK
jgi:sugar phosphate isomerase/epimerase